MLWPMFWRTATNSSSVGDVLATLLRPSAPCLCPQPPWPFVGQISNLAALRLPEALDKVPEWYSGPLSTLTRVAGFPYGYDSESGAVSSRGFAGNIAATRAGWDRFPGKPEIARRPFRCAGDDRISGSLSEPVR